MHKESLRKQFEHETGLSVYVTDGYSEAFVDWLFELIHKLETNEFNMESTIAHSWDSEEVTDMVSKATGKARMEGKTEAFDEMIKQIHTLKAKEKEAES